MAIVIERHSQVSEPAPLASQIDADEFAGRENRRHVLAVGRGRGRRVSGFLQHIGHLAVIGCAGNAPHVVLPKQFSGVGIDAVQLSRILVGTGQENSFAPDNR